MLILLYIFDSLRSDFLGCYGDPGAHTPHLDGFAAMATRYRTAYAPAPWSKASGAALLTGRLPRAVRMHTLLEALPSGVPTLAEQMREAGFRTVAVSANPFIAHDFGLLRGFDQSVEGFRPGVFPEEPLRFHPNHFRRVAQQLSAPVEALVVPRSAALHRALLEHLVPGEPIFALCWSMDTHAPFVVRGDESLFGNPLDRLVPAADAEWLQHGITIADLIRLYRDMIAYSDAQFGALMAELQRRQLWEDALIVVAGDHGEAFGEHGVLGHTNGLWEEQIRIPLLIKRPNQARARVVDGVCSLLDLWPTLAEWLPAGTPEPGWGMALPTEGQRSPHPLLIEGRDGWALRDGQWKLVAPSVDEVPLLFNIETDPGEQRPLPEPTLRDQLLAIARQLQQRADAEATQWPRVRPVEHPDVLSRLRNLGYL